MDRKSDDVINAIILSHINVEFIISLGILMKSKGGGILNNEESHTYSICDLLYK